MDPETIFLVFPFVQVTLFFISVCVNFTLIVGEENSKLLALNEIHPLCSPVTVVATFVFPSEETTEMLALIGADVKP